MEDRIVSFAFYVTMAKAQRLHCNEIVRYCKDKYEQNSHLNHSEFVIAFDCAQTLDISHFKKKILAYLCAICAQLIN